MGKKIKTINLSDEAIEKVEKMAKEEKRSFSQCVELIILKSK